MKSVNRSFISRLILICVLSLIISGCWIRIGPPRPRIVHLWPCFLWIEWVETYIRLPEPDEICRLLRGIMIPVQWNIVADSDTFEVEGQLVPTSRDPAVEAELDSLFPPQSGYKWVGFSTDSSLNSVPYPDTVTTRFVYLIDRNLPTGPEEAMVYEKSGEDCEHRWGADAEFMTRVPGHPTLSEWVLIILALSVAGFFVWQLKTRGKAAVSLR